MRFGLFLHFVANSFRLPVFESLLNLILKTAECGSRYINVVYQEIHQDQI